MSLNDDIKNFNTRRRNILFLIQQFLLDNTLTETAKQLAVEANLTKDYELCDNVDLDSIYLDAANYFQLRFGKYPRILRKSTATTVKVNLPKKKVKPQPPKDQNITQEAAIPELEICVRKVDTTVAETPTDSIQLQPIEHMDLATVYNSAEYNSLADLVKSSIFTEDLQLQWSDMFGNSKCIDIIKEAVLAPIKYPQLFAHGLKPWRSALLHGPPGSGKTLLAKILYSQTRNQVTFFNMNSSVIVSKWRGESEKILHILFHMARRMAPAILFFDEIESLTSRRDRAGDHESSKRFKSEFLKLLDGMEQHNSGVFVLAISNLPWDIDEAFLRRFEKKLLVQLPNEAERAQMIEKQLPVHVQVTTEQMKALVKLSEHFTGDEIRLACKEIAMQTVRHILTKGSGDKPTQETQEKLHVPLEFAFKQIKPLSLQLMHKHQQWQQTHGS